MKKTIYLAISYGKMGIKKSYVLSKLNLVHF